MAKVELKQPIVAEISELLNGAASAVVVDYRGLTVEQDTQLRKKLRESDVSYKVYKNTMIRFAVKGTEFEGLVPHLEGPTALAVSKADATAPARILADFAKTADKLELKAGVVEGTYYDEKGTPGDRNHPVQRGYFWEDCWEACSLRSPTSPVCLIRSQSPRAARQRHNRSIRPSRRHRFLKETEKNWNTNYNRRNIKWQS